MLMLKCWEEHPNKRPTFSDLRVTLKEMEGNHPVRKPAAQKLHTQLAMH